MREWEELDCGECGCGKFFTHAGWMREHICLSAQVSSILTAAFLCILYDFHDKQTNKEIKAEITFDLLSDTGQLSFADGSTTDPV